MKTWEETKADIMAHLQKELPRPLVDHMMASLTDMESGRILMDAFTSYVRRIEVGHAYDQMAALVPKITV